MRCNVVVHGKSARTSKQIYVPDTTKSVGNISESFYLLLRVLQEWKEALIYESARFWRPVSVYLRVFSFPLIFWDLYPHQSQIFDSSGSQLRRKSVGDKWTVQFLLYWRNSTVQSSAVQYSTVYWLIYVWMCDVCSHSSALHSSCQSLSHCSFLFLFLSLWLHPKETGFVSIKPQVEFFY